MYKKHFSRFLALHPDELHFTAHSHHFWPDVTRDAILHHWDDSARYVDNKWERIMDEVFHPTQKLIADLIGSETPEQIVFGANTHEFICRLLSCFRREAAFSILTTDSEFHSFWRQARRLEEEVGITVKKIPVEPIGTFNGRFIEALRQQQFELIFLSQVFYNSGRAIADLDAFMQALIELASLDTVIVLDGYHAFCALPTTISPFADRVFYLAGGYKYAQAGEGVCFLHSPPGSELRPVNTGWFADFGGLSSDQHGAVAYAKDGLRFAGATFDPGGVYRLKSVLELFRSLGLESKKIHEHVKNLQDFFISRLGTTDHPVINQSNLLYDSGSPHGHFLTFVLGSQKNAADFCTRLKKVGVYTDHRGNHLRMGFGIYHEAADIEEFFSRLPKT